METGEHLEQAEAWGADGAEWARIERLLQLAKSADREELSPERREQIRERLFARLERDRIRRRRARFFLASAAVLLVGTLLTKIVRARLAAHA